MLIGERQLFEPIWQEIADYIYPRRGEMTTRLSPGIQRTRRLFDSTAIVAAERLKAAMAGTITPSTIQWFDTGFPNAMGMKVPKSVEDYTQGLGRFLFNDLENSNFDTEIQEVYYDIVTFGTGAVLVEDEFGKPVFRALHPNEYAIWCDSSGRIVKLIRDVEMTIREAAKVFGFDMIHPDMQRRIMQNENVDEKFMFAQWIANREDEVFGFPIDNFPVASVYVDLKHKHVVRRKGFSEWPVPVIRWDTSSGEMYGRSPSWTALPDVASLNKAEELSLRAWAMAVMPPLLALHDGILGKPDLRPSRLNFINQEGALQWFPPGTDLNIETVKKEDKRKSIWNIFFMDQVQFVPERGKTPPSAEEVRARLNIMLQILGPTLSRIDHELLVPLLNRHLGIASRSDRLPVAPPDVQQFASQFGGSLDIQFVGPIARAKRQAESQKLDAALLSLGGAAQVDPEVIDLVDLDEWVREKYRIEMVPRTLLRSRAMVDKIRKDRAERLAQQQQMVAAQQASEMGRNIAPLAKEANASQEGPQRSR